MKAVRGQLSVELSPQGLFSHNPQRTEDRMGGHDESAVRFIVGS